MALPALGLGSGLLGLVPVVEQLVLLRGFVVEFFEFPIKIGSVVEAGSITDLGYRQAGLLKQFRSMAQAHGPNQVTGGEAHQFFGLSIELGGAYPQLPFQKTTLKPIVFQIASDQGDQIFHKGPIPILYVQISQVIIRESLCKVFQDTLLFLQ